VRKAGNEVNEVGPFREPPAHFGICIGLMRLTSH
jgi:hypothetical protein